MDTFKIRDGNILCTIPLGNEQAKKYENIKIATYNTSQHSGEPNLILLTGRSQSPSFSSSGNSSTVNARDSRKRQRPTPDEDDDSDFEMDRRMDNSNDGGYFSIDQLPTPVDLFGWKVKEFQTFNRSTLGQADSEKELLDVEKALIEKLLYSLLGLPSFSAPSSSSSSNSLLQNAFSVYLEKNGDRFASRAVALKACAEKVANLLRTRPVSTVFRHISSLFSEASLSSTSSSSSSSSSSVCHEVESVAVTNPIYTGDFNKDSATTRDRRSAAAAAAAAVGKRKKSAANSKSTKRMPASAKNTFKVEYQPCCHAGPCSSGGGGGGAGSRCLCAKEQGFCEKFCACDPSTCRNQFKGGDLECLTL